MPSGHLYDLSVRVTAFWPSLHINMLAGNKAGFIVDSAVSEMS